MGLPSKPVSLVPISLPPFFFVFFFLHLLPASRSDNTNLIYRGCAQQPLVDPTGAYSQGLSSIFGTLISQSSKTHFYKSVAGAGQASISGLFQCRGDLTSSDCYGCVSRIPVLIDKLCGRTAAARIQLSGCYMLYEVSGSVQISGLDLLYKTCSQKNAGESGFVEKRDSALLGLESGMSNSGGGGDGGSYYATSYENVYVLGQCEGDLSTGDCGECVKMAVQRAQVECGGSVSGQIYLLRCFLSYSYYPHGVPNKSSAADSFSNPSSSSSGSSTGKTVAIILGVAAGVGFLVICLLFGKNLMKKHDDY